MFHLHCPVPGVRCDVPHVDSGALRDPVDEEDVGGVDPEHGVVAAALGEAGGEGAHGVTGRVQLGKKVRVII